MRDKRKWSRRRVKLRTKKRRGCRYQEEERYDVLERDTA